MCISASMLQCTIMCCEGYSYGCSAIIVALSLFPPPPSPNNRIKFIFVFWLFFLLMYTRLVHLPIWSENHYCIAKHCWTTQKWTDLRAFGSRWLLVESQCVTAAEEPSSFYHARHVSFVTLEVCLLSLFTSLSTLSLYRFLPQPCVNFALRVLCCGRVLLVIYSLCSKLL